MKRTPHNTKASNRRPDMPSTADLRGRLLRHYQAGGSAWSSLEEFARAKGLPWPDALALVADGRCSLRLRDAILAMDRV